MLKIVQLFWWNIICTGEARSAKTLKSSWRNTVETTAIVSAQIEGALIEWHTAVKSRITSPAITLMMSGVGLKALPKVAAER